MYTNATPAKLGFIKTKTMQRLKLKNDKQYSLLRTAALWCSNDCMASNTFLSVHYDKINSFYTTYYNERKLGRYIKDINQLRRFRK